MTDTEKQHRRKVKKRMKALEKKIEREQKEIKEGKNDRSTVEAETH